MLSRKQEPAQNHKNSNDNWPSMWEENNFECEVNASQVLKQPYDAATFGKEKYIRTSRVRSTPKPSHESNTCADWSPAFEDTVENIVPKLLETVG